MSYQLTRGDAVQYARDYRFRLDSDFHALNSSEVEGVLAAADQWKYRAPKNANGSRARYFHAYLQRAARRRETESAA